MKTMIQICAVALCGMACSTADTTADEVVAPIPATRAEQPLEAPATALPTNQICQRFMQRQRACTPTFIPALVEARVKADNPPGLAALDAQKGRPALLEDAFAEWASDSEDAAIEQTCNHIANAVLPAREAELRSSVSACLENAGCDAFVACGVPLNLGRWTE